MNIAVVLGVLLVSVPALADYPIVSHRYLADPGSLVLDGRVYLYNSNDDDNALEGGYSMHSIVCVSSSDLKNWTDHGIVFEVPADAGWANNSWAPQPVARDGTVYLYFGNSASGVGVATSTTPTGRFEDARGSVLVDTSTPGAAGPDSWLFDPGVLIDDDGQAYLAFGGNGETNARIIRLGSDLTSVSGSAAQLAPPGFYEAAFLFKRDGTYYLAYSTNTANGLRIDYMTSSSPDSGYTYRGVVGDQPPVNENNNHASEFEFGGQWYHAYHNRLVATQAGIATTYKRNLALEVLNFNADGTIQEVEYTTDGVPQVGSLDPYVRVEAETTNAQSGIETEPCDEGGMNVTAIDNGDWVRVRGANFGSAGAEDFSARVASNTAGGAIELRLGAEDGTLAGTCTVPNTGGAQTWATATCAVTGATGIQDLYLKFTGSGFNVDSWQFTPIGGGTGGAGGQSAGGSGPLAGATSGGSSSTAGSAGDSSGGGGGTFPTAGAANGGAAATGGEAMSGGSSGSSGAGAAGGTSTGGTTSSGGSAAGPQEESGCGCRVVRGSESAPSFTLLSLTALMGAWTLRRRRRAGFRTTA